MRSLLIGLLALSPGLWAQDAIPAGTVLPVLLTSSLDSRKSKPGQVVTARLMQDVSLPADGKIPARAKVIGHVINIAAAPRGGARIALQFDTVNFRKRTFDIVTNLRAMASMIEIQDAQIPTTGPGVGDDWEWMDTNQIGGDAVYVRADRSLTVRRSSAKQCLAACSSRSAPGLTRAAELQSMATTAPKPFGYSLATLAGCTASPTWNSPMRDAPARAARSFWSPGRARFMSQAAAACCCVSTRRELAKKLKQRSTFRG